jgi:hypothetical protein
MERPPPFGRGRDPFVAMISAGQPPILKTLFPQIGQVPWRAGFPFFMVIR